MKYEKILAHPDKDVIDSMLMHGNSINSVVEWLKEKYPKDRTKQLGVNILTTYRREFLIPDPVSTSLAKKEDVDTPAEIDEIAIASIINEATSPALKRYTHDIISNALDIENEIKSLHKLIWDKIEGRADNEDGDELRLEEKYIIRYVDQAQKLLSNFLSVCNMLEKQRSKETENEEHDVEISVHAEALEHLVGAVRVALLSLNLETHQIAKFFGTLNSEMEKHGVDLNNLSISIKK